MRTARHDSSSLYGDTVAALSQLWRIGGLNDNWLPQLEFFGCAEQLPSIFQVGSLAAASISAQALAAAYIWHRRTDELQRVGLEYRRALAAFQGEHYLMVDGEKPALHSPLTGYYETRDGRWVQLHAGFSTHRDILLQELGCGNDRAQVRAVLMRRDADEIESTLLAAGVAVSKVRTSSEWGELPQAEALRNLPLFSIERIGAGPIQPVGCLHRVEQPLSGVRVLDLSRVIAAPVAARTLAQHGADVLAIGAGHLPNITPFQIDTGRGKRTTQLDFRKPEDLGTLKDLVRSTDVFLQAYRPGALTSRGLSPVSLSALRPGIIYVSLSAYGHEGPWSSRRGV